MGTATCPEAGFLGRWRFISQNGRVESKKETENLRGGLGGVVDNSLERGLESRQVLHGPRRPPHLYREV